MPEVIQGRSSGHYHLASMSCRQTIGAVALLSMGCGGGALDDDAAGEPEAIDTISQAETFRFGYLPVNQMKRVTVHGCTVDVQHGRYIYSIYAKIRPVTCGCFARAQAVVVYANAGLKTWFADSSVPCGSWSQVTVPTGFGPNLVGSQYEVHDTYRGNDDFLMFSAFR